VNHLIRCAAPSAVQAARTNGKRLQVEKLRAHGASYLRRRQHSEPAPDASVREWQTWARLQRLQRPSAGVAARTRKDDLRQKLVAPSVTVAQFSHRCLTKKHLLYAKFVGEFSQLSQYEREVLGGVPAWHEPMARWRQWARHMREGLDLLVGQESLFRLSSRDNFA
jgi:hypothetical protein